METNAAKEGSLSRSMDSQPSSEGLGHTSETFSSGGPGSAPMAASTAAAKTASAAAPTAAVAHPAALSTKSSEPCSEFTELSSNLSLPGDPCTGPSFTHRIGSGSLGFEPSYISCIAQDPCATTDFSSSPGPGLGPGSGSGSGPGDSSVPGSGFGPGVGSVPGHGPGPGVGFVLGRDPGPGSGSGSGPSGSSVPGSGFGPGVGSVPGHGPGPGVGFVLGHDPGPGSGSGSGPGGSSVPGSGFGPGVGSVPGHGPGPGVGFVLGRGSGPGSGSVHGHGPGPDSSSVHGHGSGPGGDSDPGHDSGPDSGPGADSGPGPEHSFHIPPRFRNLGADLVPNYTCWSPYCHWDTQKQPPWKFLQVSEPGSRGLWKPSEVEGKPKFLYETLPRGQCLLYNWEEERATNHLDQVPSAQDGSESFFFRHGHQGLLTMQLQSPMSSSTTHKDSYQPPGNLCQPLRGKREAMLEMFLYHQICKEVQVEQEPTRTLSEVESVTHHDYRTELVQAEPPTPTKPHDYQQEQPETFWLQRAPQLPGVSNIRTLDTPFRKNCSFSTPVPLSLGQPVPYEPESYPYRMGEISSLACQGGRQGGGGRRTTPV
ncbi:sperm-associated antigen 8 isoform X2 [Tupaia chinensis]|uniref:sperm-associated antigen 8 isoform X2 n=1 Tax=Tupaia chinensis TaxID=246437 RepID=UPI0003C8F550|nr:sperm-associated antigen 8 isoform X2 [Tupaia chinensis]